MGTLSPWHLIIIAVVLLLVFGGRGKLSGIMGDAAKGIRAFRDGLKDEQPTPPPSQPAQTLPPAQPDKDTVAH
jgi:sec-independent protein translocase protein TatA